MSKFKNNIDTSFISQHITPIWAIIVRSVLSLLVIVIWVLGAVNVIEFSIAISISLCILGAICIWTAFPMFKFGKKAPAIATCISGAIVIFCGIKTILGF